MSINWMAVFNLPFQFQMKCICLLGFVLYFCSCVSPEGGRGGAFPPTCKPAANVNNYFKDFQVVMSVG